MACQGYELNYGISSSGFILCGFSRVGLLLRKGQVILSMNQGIFFDNSPSLPAKKPIMEIHFYLDSLGRIINTGSMPGMQSVNTAAE